MTNDEIIQIARRSYKSCEHIPNVKIPPEFIERFAKLVSQHERDACANIVMNKIDNTSPTRLNTPKDWWNKACQNILGAIQARGRK
jgi:hypothetical protein